VSSNLYETRRRNTVAVLAKNHPGRGGQKAMAERLEMSEAQLSQIIGKKHPKRIGDDVARRIESKYGLPEHSLDQLNFGLSPDTWELARQIEQFTPEARKNLAALLKTLKK
jgi:plasmid maintenance system antidote protein VapI